MTKEYKSWRDDGGISSLSIYKKRFAWFRIRCINNETIWLKNYYIHHLYWVHDRYNTNTIYSHKEFIGNISESEYIVRKLSENL